MYTTALESMAVSAEKMVMQYMFTGRRYFGLQKYLSACLDASRLGGKGVLVSFLGRPDNISMWGPPAAPVLGLSNTVTYSYYEKAPILTWGKGEFSRWSK